MRQLTSTAVVGSTLLAVLVVFPLTAAAQEEAGAAIWLQELDLYAKAILASITGLATILGLPVVVLGVQKTRAEIRKLELEAAALRAAGSSGGRGHGSDGVSVEVRGSQDLQIAVTADPRFLGPLLLLLDFIFAWVLLTLAGLFVRIVSLGPVGALGLIILGLVLLLPIAFEARRVRGVLRPSSRPTGKQPPQSEDSDTTPPPAAE